MPSVAQIENADPLGASQVTRLIRTIRASETYREDTARWPDIEKKVVFRAGRKKTLSGASNTSPIVITSMAHGFSNDELVTVQNILGNTAANGVWVIANATANTFELIGSTGNGAYTNGGEIIDLVSQHLSAIVAAIDGIGDGTVGIKGGRDALDYSQSRDREDLVKEALAALYTSTEDAATGAFAFGQRTYMCCSLCGCRLVNNRCFNYGCVTSWMSWGG